MALKNFFIFLFCSVTAFLSCNDPAKKSYESRPVEVVMPKAQDKQLYIGYLNSFSEEMDKTQIFCSARLKRNAHDKYQDIEAEAVKHKISQIDEYSTRYAVLESHSDEYFETHKEIWIYNAKSNLIAKGKFMRHELYDQDLESELISVYDLQYLNKTDNLINAPFYYSNIPSEGLNEVKWKDNPVLTEIEKNLITPNEFTKRVDKSENKIFKFSYNGKSFTFYSDGSIYCFIDGDMSTLVFKEENAMIFDMISTAFIQNGKPVFLLSCGQPETDYFYNYALVWNGKSYQPI
jgi:hypothetical protein